MNALLTLLPALLLNTTTAAAPDPGGSDEAVFEASLLRQMLGAEGCAGLRFYNALPDQGGAGTVMVIGIRADGAEILAGKNQPYAVNGGTASNPAAAKWLAKPDAAQACARVATGGQTSYSASITAADARALLDLEGCAAIGVSATETGFVLSAYSSVEGRMTKMGEGENYEKSSGDPCPTVCGSLTNYVNEALLNK